MLFLFLAALIFILVWSVYYSGLHETQKTESNEPLLTIHGPSKEISFYDLRHMHNKQVVFNGIRSDAIQLDDNIICWDSKNKRLLLSKGKIAYTGPHTASKAIVRYQSKTTIHGRKRWLEILSFNEKNNVTDIARVYETEDLLDWNRHRHDADKIIFSSQITPWEKTEQDQQQRENEIKQFLNVKT